MQIVIDIPEDKYNQIVNSYQGSNVRPKDYEIAVINGTPIPDNATNGDVVEIMFNEEDIWDIQTALNLHSETIGWWHSLYCED